MKKLVFILAGLLLTGFTATAETTTLDTKEETLTRFNRGYGNSFIFVEQGIEFAVFPDGQFDFNVMDYGPNFGVNANLGNVNISFNTGFDYNPYVQYDNYGAVIQIENIPIYYDFYGRIIQAGNVNISYNNFGRVARVGGLFVHYNRFNRFDYCSGFINVYNRNYVFRPWHRYYAIPAVDFCIVYNRPYRRFYEPVRYQYFRPYRDNFRSRVSVNGRRGPVAQRNDRRNAIYRTASNNTKTRVANRNSSRRSDVGRRDARRDDARITNRRTATSGTRVDRTVNRSTTVTRDNSRRVAKRGTSTVERRTSGTRADVKRIDKRTTVQKRTPQTRTVERSRTVTTQRKSTPSRSYESKRTQTTQRNAQVTKRSSSRASKSQSRTTRSRRSIQ